MSSMVRLELGLGLVSVVWVALFYPRPQGAAVLRSIRLCVCLSVRPPVCPCLKSQMGAFGGYGKH